MPKTATPGHLKFTASSSHKNITAILLKACVRSFHHLLGCKQCTSGFGNECDSVLVFLSFLRLSCGRLFRFLALASDLRAYPIPKFIGALGSDNRFPIFDEEKTLVLSTTAMVTKILF